jgi:hypothetical protein
MVIEITHTGIKTPLNTLAVAANGNILACITATGSGTKSDSTTVETDGYLQAYNPEGKLLRETAVSFVPTAVNGGPSREVVPKRFQLIRNHLCLGLPYCSTVRNRVMSCWMSPSIGLQNFSTRTPSRG